MVLSVNSSSTKVFLGFTAVATLAIGTVLFYRSLGNAAEQSKESSLANKDVSILHSIPGFSWLANFLNPSTKDEKTEKSTSSKNLKPALVTITDPEGDKPGIRTIGTALQPVTSQEQLLKTIGNEAEHKGYILVIYGKDLELTNTKVLQFDPIKLILVGASIADNSSLKGFMGKNSWAIDENNLLYVAKVDSVEEAMKSKDYINPDTNKPWPVVFSVQATTI